MPKKKNDKTADKASEQAPLTEWQKRNLEFQERKRERQAAKEAEEIRFRQERLALIRKKSLEHQSQKDPQPQANSISTIPVTPKAKQESSKGGPTLRSQPKSQSNKPRGKRQLPQHYRRALPLILSFSLLLAFSLFMTSPYSKQKKFSVRGAQHTTQEKVIVATGIKDSDYITSLIGNLKAYEKAIVNNNPWVKSSSIHYELPNKFDISIEEHPIIAYNLTDDGYRPVLPTGQQVDDFGDGELPAGSLPLAFDKASDRVKFVKQLMTLDTELRASIQEVSFAGSESTKDLLLLTMTDGHTVRVPLSEIAIKLPYYQSIKKKLTLPTIIDMEVGIYTTSLELETKASETKASKEKEKREAEEKDEDEDEDEDENTETETSSTAQP